MSSMFGDIDISTANDNPFFKPDGKYVSKITKAEVRRSKSGNKGMSLEYTIQEGPKANKKINEWKPVPETWELNGYESKDDEEAGVNQSDKIKEDAERHMAFLKQRLKQFGFTTDEMNTVQPEDFLQVPWLEIDIKNQGGQERIWGIEIYADAKSSGGVFND